MGAGEAAMPRRHVLVMEPEMITGLGLAEDLADFGCRVSGPFARLRDFASLLSSDPPDCAIVDLAVSDGDGLTAARELTSRGIPLVFFSAGDRRLYVDGEFRDVPWVDKPASIGRLLAALGLK